MQTGCATNYFGDPFYTARRAKTRVQSSQDIRRSLEMRWNTLLSKYADLFSSDAISGSSPPSVFVGTYGYPKVNVGPMVPPEHGDTSILDAPERWLGKRLDEIVDYRFSLVRGVRRIPATRPYGRYVEDLQEMAMSVRPADSELQFRSAASATVHLDGHSAPFGPVGEIRTAKFSGSSPHRKVERVYYDADLHARDAVLNLYREGVGVSSIQKCFSIGMMGHKRRLVPTRWSITATDSIISSHLVELTLDFEVLDEYRVFFFEHLGNLFSVVLFPHRWLYEMIEAWYSNGIMGFGSDHEDYRGMNRKPAIAGAYFAAKLAVAEYLVKNEIQAGVLVLREISPEYSIPVGVWQVREGVRAAMKQKFSVSESFEQALDEAAGKMSISGREWLEHGKIASLLKQQAISDFF